MTHAPTKMEQRALDARAAGRIARNGAGLHACSLATKAPDVVGALDRRTPSICPYGVGTDCPLMAIIQRNTTLVRASSVLAIIAGVALSIVVVLI